MEYRVVIPDAYLSTVAAASTEARQDLVDLLRALAREPRAVGTPIPKQPASFRAVSGRVIADFDVADEPKRIVSIYRVVVAD